jgi:aryl-alcohol dehydrogenase-like predicted oxidoreductase
MSPHRLVLAWMLAKSPCALPIPGARRTETIVDCAGAADVELGPSDMAAVEASFSGH